jgi:hypothetical protein
VTTFTANEVSEYAETHGCSFQEAKRSLELPKRRSEHQKQIDDVQVATTVEDLKAALLYVLYKTYPT